MEHEQEVIAVTWSPRLGAHLEASRVQAGLRRVDLASRLGVSEESVRLWERGAVQPSEEHLVRIIPMLSVEAPAWSGRGKHPDDEVPTLARRLQEERAGRSLTQAAMAALVGAPQPTYAGWETGRTTPSEPYLGIIAELLGISVVALDELCANPFEVDVDGWPAFGQLVGQRRQALRLTRAALAAELDVSPRTVANWELGLRRPAPAQVLAIAELVGVPVAELIAALPQRLARSPLGELILARQRELGLRSADVARLVGTTEPTLSRWVNGHSRPLGRNLDRLAAALGLPPRQLLDAVGP